MPGKNIKLINGKPLIAWTIEQSLACREISKTIVSTDDTQIADIARKFGAEVPFIRPPELALDTTPTEPVMAHAINWLRDIGEYYDNIILLQPTSPLRLNGSLSAAIQRFENQHAKSLLSVCENHHFFWRTPHRPHALYNYRNRPRRQDIKDDDRIYRENGSIYITRTDDFLKNKNRLCQPIAMYLMREEEGWEIDSHADFKVVESLMNMAVES